MNYKFLQISPGYPWLSNRNTHESGLGWPSYFLYTAFFSFDRHRRVHSSSMAHNARGGGKNKRNLPFKRRSENHCLDLLSQSRFVSVHRIFSVRDICAGGSRIRGETKVSAVSCHFEDATKLLMRRRRRVMTFRHGNLCSLVTKRSLKHSRGLQQWRNC